MATIIEALLVTLGLDDAEFQKRRKGVDDGLDKTRGKGRETASEIDDFTKNAALGFSKLRGEVVGMFLAFAGAKTATEFLTNLVTQVREMGTAAQIMGLQVNTLNAWGNAAKDAGGQASDAIQAFATINDYFADFTRHPEIIGQKGKLFNQLGLTGESDFSDPEQTLLRLAGQFQKEMATARASGDPEAEHRTRATFEQRLREFGITSQSMIRLIESGTDALKKEIEANKKRNTVTEQDVKAAQDATAAFNHLTMALFGLAQSMGVIKTIDALAEGFDYLSGTSDRLGANARILTAGFLALIDPVSQLILFLQKTGIISKETAATALAYTPAGYIVSHGDSTETATQDSGGIGTSSGRFNTGRNGRDAGTALKYLLANNVPMDVALGLTSVIVAEGGLGSPTGGGHHGRAIGVGQLLGTRRKAFLAKYGPHFTFENELEWMVHELRGGDPGGKSVLSAGSSDAAIIAAVTRFYRPAPGHETAGDIARARAFLQHYRAAAAKGHKVNVTVYADTQSRGHDIARKTGSAVKKALAGGPNVVNANSGVVG